MIEYELTPAADLTDDDWARWDEIQSTVTELDSPFFRPELTRITAQVRSDVEVVTIRNDGETVGFFPFQRCTDNTAQAVTGRLSEFHGVVSLPTADWSAGDLLKQCNLRSWHFDHLPVSQSEFAAHTWGTTSSPYMDLSEGYEQYRESQRRSGSSLSQAERKSRKLEREAGPLRFELDTSAEHVLADLIEWKTAQHQRTNVLQVLKKSWVASLLEALCTCRTEGFSAPLSALYAGETLVAVHLGLCSRTALHIWFPAYDVRFEKYSPGVVLLLQLAREANARGITRIDFGRGEERYKANFKSGDLQIAEGKISRGTFDTAMHAAWYRTKLRIRASPWRRQLETPITATRRLRQWVAFR